ncbi:MAG: type II secretion system protein [Bacillota bacterium]|nr:type II secretion system protein [Bacillota bacterium]
MPTSGTGRSRARGAVGGRGFTLLEVVVAVALLGIALTALVEGFTHGVGVLSALAERETLGTAAANQAALLAVGVEPGTSGLGNDPSLRWRWEPPRGSGVELGEPGRVTVSRLAWRARRETAVTLSTWAGARR